jgi:hypothetical protein
VKIRRELAAEHPVVYNRDLAKSLLCLSHALSDLGHQADALQATQEAFFLLR